MAGKDSAEAAQIAMKRTVDALGRRIQGRVFEDQIAKFCSVEKDALKHCRLANNRNPSGACVHIEQLLDQCTIDNVRLVSDFRTACRKQVERQESCIGGIFKPELNAKAGRMETCNDVVNELADCIGMGWTSRVKKVEKPSLFDSFLPKKPE